MSVRAKVWTREEYDRLIAAGGFQPDSRVQLIRGEIVEMAPQGARHATAIRLTQKQLERHFTQGFEVRTQLPVALGEWSEPEPDIAVVRGSTENYRDQHPKAAVLVVEVADTTLEFDRTSKLQMYAEAGIPEYWIVNLVNRMLEVYRTPHGTTYHDSLRVDPGEDVAPLAAPTATIRVSDILP